MAEKPTQTKAAEKPAGNPDAAALAAENAELKKQLAQAEARAGDGGFSAEDQQLVELKVAAGLPRDQAIEVVKAQKAHDARLAAEKK